MPTGRFSFVAFAAVLLLLVALVCGLNWLIDPLWYVQGNRLTGRNFAFNERLSKVNLLQRTVNGARYDCLIVGSSRVTALRPSQFGSQRCFNLAVKGADVREFTAYARHAKSLGVQARTVYVGVDDFNFLDQQDTARRSNPRVVGTPNLAHAFASSDVLLFSLMTLAGVSPDPHMYYDRAFEAAEFAGRTYAGPFAINKPNRDCAFDNVARYVAMREVYPQARWVGYVPPMTPWYRLSDVYSRGVLDCSAEAFHRVAQGYDAFWDFAIPSDVTTAADTSFDGSHFSPAANDQVAAQLTGTRKDLALDVKAMALTDYQAEVRKRLRGFLDDHERSSDWSRLGSADDADASR